MVDDNRELRELVGEFGANLKLVEAAFETPVSQRGNELHIGPGAAAKYAAAALRQLLRLVRGGMPLRSNDVRQALRILDQEPGADLRGYFQDTVVQTATGRSVVPRTPGQRRYIEALRKYDVVFGVGPAGTGKTYLAVAQAAAALQRGDCARIVLTRPAVEAGEKLGFLPGDLTDKVDPYLRPLYDALYDMLTPEKTARLLEKQVIEVAPLAFMRGRTLSNATVILDEAQNTTVEQMKMFLTRLGDRSRMVITGDTSQVDLPRNSRSGLVHSLDVLSSVDRIGVVHFTSADVVRHPLVSSIVEAYELDETRRAGEDAARRRAGDAGWRR